MKTMLKAFRLDRQGNPRFLFQPHNGCISTPINKWLYAEPKLVTNGTNAPWYRSGFHGFETMEHVDRWLRRCIHPVFIARVEIKKPRGDKKDWVLSQYMKLTSEAWAKRIEVQPKRISLLMLK